MRRLSALSIDIASLLLTGRFLFVLVIGMVFYGWVDYVTSRGSKFWIQVHHQGSITGKSFRLRAGHFIPSFIENPKSIPSNMTAWLMLPSLLPDNSLFFDDRFSFMCLHIRGGPSYYVATI